MNADDFVDLGRAPAPIPPQRPYAASPPTAPSTPPPPTYVPPPMNVPPPPGTWVGQGAPVPPAPTGKRRAPWVFAGVVVGLLALGYGALIVRGQLIERDVERASTEWFDAVARGDDVAPLLDGGDGCAQPDEFIPPEAAIEWEPTGARYGLNSDGNGGTFNLSTLDAALVDDFRSGRPSGTDFGVAFGVLRVSGSGIADVRVLFIREPGSDWLVCLMSWEP